MRKPTELDIYIGDAIRVNRLIKKKTRAELGKSVTLCYQQIGQYERGTHQITVNKLLEISKVLKVKFEKFLPPEILDKRLKVPKRHD